MWDVTTGACIMTLRGHTQVILLCCLSSTDQFIVSTDLDNTLKIWDVATGNCTQTLPAFGSRCALSSDDQRIVAAKYYNDEILRLLNIETGEIHAEQIATGVRSVCWSSDDQFLVLGTYEGIQIRDPNTLQLFNLDETDSG
jgi:WD40 repeat protein